MATNRTNRELLALANSFIPKLNTAKDDKHKGNCGYLAVVGGSEEYTGAPYFAAITGLRVGCDLAHIICPSQASLVIKTQSPDIIVHPWFDNPNCPEMFSLWIDRFNVVIMGPGMGRLSSSEDMMLKLYEISNSKQKPLIIDADGLFFVSKYPEKFRNYSSDLILTPNAMEFSRIAQKILNKPILPKLTPDEDILKEIQQWFGEKTIIFHKGQTDYICGAQLIKGGEPGSPRRCGGQGDLLAGAIGTFFIWAQKTNQEEKNNSICNKLLACYAASTLIRKCSNIAYNINRRGMIASDMVPCVPEAFRELFET